jgi:hypothetical protein
VGVDAGQRGGREEGCAEQELEIWVAQGGERYCTVAEFGGWKGGQADGRVQVDSAEGYRLRGRAGGNLEMLVVDVESRRKRRQEGVVTGQRQLLPRGCLCLQHCHLKGQDNGHCELVLVC